MSAYRIAVNIEWTSKCNARCAMCPREVIERPQAMTEATWPQVLARLSPTDVFRAVIAGYGEPTTQPRFFEWIDDLRRHAVHFDMVSNGQQLDEARIGHLDGAIGTLIVSFSSIDPEVYRRVHVNLDQARVMHNIRLASRLFSRTRLAISLTPMPECLPSLPATVAWLRAQGIELLTMSPTLYNRAGDLERHALATTELRRAIRRFGLRSQEFDFVPGFRDLLGQWRSNRLRCVPRNTDLLIAANGDYLWCYNDVRHAHEVGNVREIGIRAALARREATAAIAALCDDCNLRHRYGPGELAAAGLSYARMRLGIRRRRFTAALRRRETSRTRQPPAAARD